MRSRLLRKPRHVADPEGRPDAVLESYAKKARARMAFVDGCSPKLRAHIHEVGTAKAVADARETPGRFQ